MHDGGLLGVETSAGDPHTRCLCGGHHSVGRLADSLELLVCDLHRSVIKGDHGASHGFAAICPRPALGITEGRG